MRPTSFLRSGACGAVSEKGYREVQVCYQKSGDRRNVCKSDLGKKEHCNIIMLQCHHLGDDPNDCSAVVS